MEFFTLENFSLSGKPHQGGIKLTKVSQGPAVFLKRKKGCSPDIMKGEGIGVESVARNDIIA